MRDEEVQEMRVPQLVARELPATVAADHFSHESGHAWIVYLDAGPYAADDTGSLRASSLTLLEDGLPLGPAHSGHDDIRKLGRGRFSHWRDRLYFSTSDNSDPRSNGRRYELAVSSQSLSMPSTMHVALTSACNLTCRTCRPEHPRATSLDDRLIDQLIEQVFPTLTDLRLDIAGEPTLHRAKFRRIIDAAARHGVSVFICTNAMLIDDELASWLCANPAMAKIQLSLDSVDPERLEWIRRGATLDGITQGIRRLVKYRKAEGRQDLVFNVHAALLSNNIDELPDFVRYCADQGVETLSNMFGFVQSFMSPDLSVFWDKPRHNARIDEATELAKQLGVAFNYWGKFNLDRPAVEVDIVAGERTPCHYLTDWTAINSDGHVGPCCLDIWFDLGDLQRSDFSTLWHGEAYEALRRTHATDNPTNPKCAACYNRLNWDVNSFRPYFHPDHWPEVRRRLGLPAATPV
jgi:MoaA/NifB/PqqE/SkfB family radical SAM enzyme